MQTQPTSRLFPTLALTTAILTIGLIIVGAVVRVSDSGLGCGNDWPFCNGSIFPPLDNLNAWIEWSHRLFAALIGALGVAMLVAAIVTLRQRNPFVLKMTILAAVLYASQAILGAIVVKLDLPPTFVTLHLGVAMLLLAALLVSGLAASYTPSARYTRDEFTSLAYVTAALSLVIILTGALVRGSGAMLACVDWPLCNGELFPVNQGQLAMIHMLHRAAVLGLGVVLVLLVWTAYRTRTKGRIRGLSVTALVLFFSQAGIGAMYVISRAEPIWGAAHVLFASLTWAALVALCLYETLNTRPSGQQTEVQWQQSSEAALN